MRRLLPVLLTLLALVLMPSAAAHLSIKATPPTGYIPHDAPTRIPVEVSAGCVDVLAEYQAMGKSEMEIALAEPPEWLSAKGDKVPFTVDRCGTDANVRAQGHLEITPGPLAPGLQAVNLRIIAKGESAQALTPITIAYRGQLQVTLSAEEFPITNHTASAQLLFNATLNADSMVMIEVLQQPQHGSLELATSVNIASALSEGSTFRTTPFGFTYHARPDANFTADTVVLRVMMHAVADPGAATESQEITLHFTPSAEPLEIPPPPHADAAGAGLPLLLLAASAAAIAARRRQ